MGKEDQGVTLDRFMLIPRTLVFLTRGNRILLIKGSPNKRLWANLYNGVGGHIERGEDVLSAARREIQEETGLVPEDLWLTGVITIDTGEQAGIGIFVLRGTSEQGDAIASGEGELEWVSQDDFASIRMVEDLPVLLEKVLPMKPGDSPFFARYSYDQDNQLVIQFAEAGQA